MVLCGKASYEQASMFSLPLIGSDMKGRIIESSMKHRKHRKLRHFTSPFQASPKIKF
jgi:hypothetical protein